MTPIKVTNSGDSQDGSSTSSFSFGGALFVLADMVSAHLVNVYKSTDNGLTWTGPHNAINAPQLSIASGGKATAWDCVSTVVSGTLIVGYLNPGTGNLAVQSFNLTTLLWSSINDSGFNAFSGDDTTEDVRVRIVRRASTGDLWVFFTEWLTTNQTINYSIVSGGSGGSWGANTVAVPSSGTIFNYPGNVFLDSNGLFHIFYRKAATQGAVAALYHRTLTTGGSVGAENQISATTSDIPFGTAFEFNGLPRVIHYDSNSRTGLWTGDSLTSPTPTWTFELINNLTWAAGIHDIGPQQVEAGSPAYGAKGFGFVSGGIAYIIWQSTSDDGSGTDFSTNRIYMRSNSGSGWGTAVLLYNNVTDPAPILGTDKLNALTAEIVSNVLYVFVDVDCGGLFMVSAASVTPLSIVCGNPPQGDVGEFYTHTFTAAGGTAPYTYGIGGFIPPGLTLNSSTGVLSGIPTLAGTFNFSITVVDVNGQSASVSCSIVIVQFSLDCASPPDGTVGVAYLHFLEVVGGTSPFAFVLFAGALPDGLVLGAVSGSISGTPTAAGSFTFTIRVTDTNGLIAFVTCTITIATVCDALRNPQIPGTQVPIDADTELYLRRFINDMSGAMTPSDQN